MQAAQPAGQPQAGQEQDQGPVSFQRPTPGYKGLRRETFDGAITYIYTFAPSGGIVYCAPQKFIDI
jgi:hypothetical protein